MRLRTLSTIMGLMLMARWGFCLPADVTPLANKEYFFATQKAISQAKKSIDIVMYLISFNKDDKKLKVTQLMDELVRAKHRGVEVKVILDYQKDGYKTNASEDNLKAFNFLKDNGIKVYFDSVGAYTHTKAIVIDKRIIIAGSHNWTEVALTRSNEISFLMDSPKLAEQLLGEFSRIKLAVGWLNESPGVNIPYWALGKKGVVPEMLRRCNERGFDLWLLLLRDFDGNAKGIVDTNYEVLAENLGLLKSLDRRGYRKEINRQLRNLSRLYPIIEIDTHINQPIKIKLIKIPGKESFKLPKVYWEYGWANRLSMAAKACLLINLAELGGKQGPPEWMVARPQISEKYGIEARILYKGMKELRDYHIIEVRYSQLDEGYENRMPSTTIFLGLYDMCEFEQSLARLEEIYGKELIAKSREYAFVVFKGYDLAVIEQIAKLINIHGEVKVDKAFRLVEQKKPGNPKRVFGYVIGILGKMEGK
ncbi:MAG: phospholipase D-like domain-containing protein [Candidatus Omnitrophota bacterium]